RSRYPRATASSRAPSSSFTTRVLARSCTARPITFVRLWRSAWAEAWGTYWSRSAVASTRRRVSGRTLTVGSSLITREARPIETPAALATVASFGARALGLVECGRFMGVLLPRPGAAGHSHVAYL